MLDFIVQQQTQNDFITWVSFGADLCILGITVYTTWKTFFEKRIKLLSYSPHFQMFGGDYITIVVENPTLSPISIEKVDIIYEDCAINMCKYDEPLIIEPQKAIKIKMEPFSELYGVSLHDISKKDFVVRFVTSKGIIFSKFSRFRFKYNKNAPYEYTTVIRRTYNGYIVTPDIKYALLTVVDGKTQTIFINDGGLLSSDIYGYNAIPRKDIDNIELVKQHIEAIIRQYNPNQIIQLVPYKQMLN